MDDRKPPAGSELTIAAATFGEALANASGSPLTPEECAAVHDVIQAAQEVYFQGGCTVAAKVTESDL